jgi:hypothetical protein
LQKILPLRVCSAVLITEKEPLAPSRVKHQNLILKCGPGFSGNMEPELETLIAIKKPAWLVGKEFLVLFEGRPVRTTLTQLNMDGTFGGLYSAGVPYPGTIRPEELMIGIGTQLRDDPVLLALQEYRLKPHLFSVAVPSFGAFPGNEQGGVPRANGNQVRFGAPPEFVNNPPEMGGFQGRAPPAQMP